ncbi:hypothetical protein CCR94_21725 [Rhodoblastus sphagnicola]|uniref:Uncharacterized protein n=1 Tax=Rhodoblastus sphagnicola TaxID=333368 RepID=A0A2S6MWJ8_9HYPH|nr:hypothetical protein CCR94_21725 [Rhodoblastus sphagnicola]
MFRSSRAVLSAIGTDHDSFSQFAKFMHFFRVAERTTAQTANAAVGVHQIARKGPIGDALDI